MVQHLHASFLENKKEYIAATQHWINLWEQIDKFQREMRDWRHPWLLTGIDQSKEFLDGNPIFSACSPLRHEGIRIIQYAPSSDKVEFDYWLDSFGGDQIDPSSIRELVIACALSEESSRQVFKLMQNWILHGDVSRQSILSPVIDYDFNMFTPAVSLTI